MCSGSSLHFLSNCGFDFNKLIAQGTKSTDHQLSIYIDFKAPHEPAREPAASQLSLSTKRKNVSTGIFFYLYD
jgi:hypothetical protein